MARFSDRPETFFRIGPAQPGKAQCFAVQRGQIEGRIDAKYYALWETLRSRFPLANLGNLVATAPAYGSGARAIPRTNQSQPRYIRITDFGDDGIESGHEFVTADPIEPGYELKLDDMLFARSGSVGRTYLHEDDNEPALFAGYCIRFRFDESKVYPRFVYWWSKTKAYDRWVAAIQRPSVQSNINMDEFKHYQIPLPPLELQDQLVETMEAAQADRKAKLEEAATILAGLDNFVLDSLGLTITQQDDRRVFGIHKGDVDGLQLSVSMYAPQFQKFLDGLRGGSIPTEPLSTFVEVNPSASVSGLDDDAVVGFIPMQAVSDGATGEYVVSGSPYGKVKKGYTPFINGDILWAKITPCMQNGKSCIVDELPSGVGFGSTEFHVLRVCSPGISKEFVKEFVSQAALRRIATYAFTGSAGQQRVPASFLESLPFPRISEKKQDEIVAATVEGRAKAHALRVEAEAGLQAATRWFEEQLLETLAP